jgi:hypothetical protein
MDFDPRDYDSRDDERFSSDRDHGSRRDRDHRNRADDDLGLLDAYVRDHGDDDAREPGRGSGEDSRQSKDCDGGPDPRDDARWPDRDTPERDLDPREVFTRGLRLASLRRPGPAEAGHYVRE